jgi:hypothetical protein
LNSGGSFQSNNSAKSMCHGPRNCPGSGNTRLPQPQLPGHRDPRQVLLGRCDAEPISQVGSGLSSSEVPAGRSSSRRGCGPSLIVGPTPRPPASNRCQAGSWARSTNADEQSCRERVTAESAVDKSRKTGPGMAQSAGLHCGLPKVSHATFIRDARTTTGNNGW